MAMDDATMRVMQHAASGYCCSQIIMLFALEAQGRENPALVRAMSGACHGLGDCSGPCGALTAAVCVLGLYAGKGDDTEEAHERFPLMRSEIIEWFQSEIGGQYGGTRCLDILGDKECGSPNPERCPGVVAATWGKCLEILVENGLDPSSPKEEQ